MCSHFATWCPPFDPTETGYVQTYPEIGDIMGQGTGVSVAPPPPGVADWGWAVDLTAEFPDQGDLNFDLRIDEYDFATYLCRILAICERGAERLETEWRG